MWGAWMSFDGFLEYLPSSHDSFPSVPFLLRPDVFLACLLNLCLLFYLSFYTQAYQEVQMLRHQSIHSSPFNFLTTLSLDGLLNGSIFVMGVIMCFILVGVVHFTNKAASRNKISELPQTIQQQQNPLNSSLLQSPIMTVAETLTTCSVSPPRVSSRTVPCNQTLPHSAVAAF